MGKTLLLGFLLVISSLSFSVGRTVSDEIYLTAYSTEELRVAITSLDIRGIEIGGVAKIRVYGEMESKVDSPMSIKVNPNITLVHESNRENKIQLCLEGIYEQKRATKEGKANVIMKGSLVGFYVDYSLAHKGTMKSGNYVMVTTNNIRTTHEM